MLIFTLNLGADHNKKQTAAVSTTSSSSGAHQTSERPVDTAKSPQNNTPVEITGDVSG